MKRKVYILSFILLIIDIISKQLIKNLMPINTSIIVIKNFFNITFVINTGAAFSILRGQQLFLIILGILVLGGVIYYLRKDKLNNYKVIYYSLLIGGIIGNLIDRIIYNGVIDFLDFKIFLYDAPIFNLADTFICISVFLIIFESLRRKKWNLK
ncbi:MAG: signal peptidase II [Bacilli bacterium]|nr:signal peptidase II [Bacilli bacterium]